MKDNQNTKPNYFYDEDIISSLDVLLKISQNISIIFITPTILCSLMIFYVSFVAEPEFTSSAKILSGSGNTNTQVSGIAAQFGFRMPMNQSEPKWVYPDIIKSRTLARAVINRKFDSEQFGKQKRLLQILTYGNTNLIKI